MAAGIGDIRFSGGAAARLALSKKKKKKKKKEKKYTRHMLRRDFCSTRGANRWPVSRKLIETLVFEIRTKNTKSCPLRTYYTYIVRVCMYRQPFYNRSARLFSELDVYKKMYGKKNVRCATDNIQRCVIGRNFNLCSPNTRSLLNSEIQGWPKVSSHIFFFKRNIKI